MTAAAVAPPNTEAAPAAPAAPGRSPSRTDHEGWPRIEPFAAIVEHRRFDADIAAELAVARAKIPIDETKIDRIDKALEPHITAAVAKPADYLTDLLGRRPKDPDDARAWDSAAESVERWRHHNGLTPQDKSNSLDRLVRALGPEPKEANLEYDLAVREAQDLKFTERSRSLGKP